MARRKAQARHVRRGLSVGTRNLQRELAMATAALHPRPNQLRSDPELFQALLLLYGVTPERIWSERLRPLLIVDAQPLAVLYEEHAALADAAVLDLIEAPMVLERLRNASAHLQAIWPLDRSDLVLVSAACGLPIYHAA
jgi:hypothetical protein